MRSTFNRSRNLYDCKPDCPGRKPGCQDHCEHYQERRAANEARKIEVYGDYKLKQYMAEKITDRKNQAAIRHKDRKQRGPAV